MASYEWPPQGSGTGGGVSSLNSLTGAITLVAGTGISITPSGSNITITNTGDVASGNLTDIGTDGITITNGTGAVLVGGGTQIAQAEASASQNGYLSSADFTAFNNKGSVSSVGLTAPSFLSVGGSPVTGSGTLALSYSGTALPIANGGTAVTSVTTIPTASSFSGWDANVNLSSNNFLSGFQSIVTAAGTTTLTITSPQITVFTGSTTQTCLLPVAATLPNGYQLAIINTSSGIVAVQTSGANTIANLGGNRQVNLVCMNNAGGTGTASWTWIDIVNNNGTLPISSGGTGVTSVTTAPAATAFAGWDANKNLSANAMFGAFTTTATAAGTTALTIASTQFQAFTGSTTQTVTLPTTGVVAGMNWIIYNLSTGVVTLEASGGGTVQAMAANTFVVATANAATPTTAAGWYWQYDTVDSTVVPISLGGTGASTLATGAISSNGTVLSSGTLTVANGGTASTSVTIAPTATHWAGWDASTNFSAGAFIEGFTTTATAAGTTALTITSKGIQFFTGTNIQTVTLPTTSVAQGAQYFIANRSTGIVTVQSSGANTIQAMASGTEILLTALVATPTTAANWDAVYTPQSPPTASYSQAFFGNASSWTVTSTTYADPTNAGGNTLTVRKSAGITLTAASAGVCGVTFTPANAQAVYKVTAAVICFPAIAQNLFSQLTDGTTVITNIGCNTSGVAVTVNPTILSGIYAPASASAVTVKIQLAGSGGVSTISTNGTTLTNSVEWTVERIA